jgi:hypothetical protein
MSGIDLEKGLAASCRPGACCGTGRAAAAAACSCAASCAMGLKANEEEEELEPVCASGEAATSGSCSCSCATSSPESALLAPPELPPGLRLPLAARPPSSARSAPAGELGRRGEASGETRGCTATKPGKLAVAGGPSAPEELESCRLLRPLDMEPMVARMESK